MSYNNYNREFELNEAKAEEFLLNAVEKVEKDEDIDTLTELIAIFKKTVPLTRRKYVKAFLLKEALKHYHSYGKSTKNERNSNRGNAKAKNENREYKNEYKVAAKQEKAVEVQAEAETEERPRHPRVEIDPALATSIFVSIGKNRRVYPRDLVGLLVAVGGIDRERIGDIKVLANYSFVQLYTEDCQTAIDKLNGYDYRGRKLAVSFSRQKDEESEETVAENQISEESDMTAEDAAAYAAAEKAAADKEPFGNIN